MKYTPEILHFIRETTWEDLPSPVQHQAKRCLLDGMGSLLAGTETPAAKITAAFAADQLPGDEATLLGSRARVSAVGAALANGFAANALDVDDGHRLIKGHPGSPLFPVLFASCERAPVSGKELLTALIIGYEVGIRAGLIRHATTPQYHSSGSWGAIAGAAAGGRLLGLQDEVLRQALGTAEYHAPIAPMMKGIATPSMGKDSIGWGCMVAMSSLLMAEGGFTGIQPLFEEAPDPEWITSLGEEYRIMNLYFKPYCACRWAQPAVAGALALTEEHTLHPEDIAEITVHTFKEAAALSTDPPHNTEEAQYNMAYPIAAALLDGEVGPQQVLPPRLFDRDLQALMGKVRVTTQDRFQEAFPARALAEVAIKTTQGDTFHSETFAAPWDPDSTLPTDAELSGKFQRFVEPLLGSKKAAAIEGMIWEFDELPQADSLISTCAAED